MTESIGGSDVSLTETFAVPVDQSKNYVAKSGDPFILNGAKWFSSACEGDVALALARTAAPGSGSRGLSLFLIKLRLFTPVVKAFSANLVSKMMPNCMEALGGQGYMTENELGRLMMDAVVENIWEGTAETLALDIVRVIKQSKGEAIVSFIAVSYSPPATRDDSDSLTCSYSGASLFSALSLLPSISAPPSQPSKRDSRSSPTRPKLSSVPRTLPTLASLPPSSCSSVTLPAVSTSSSKRSGPRAVPTLKTARRIDSSS